MRSAVIGFGLLIFCLLIFFKIAEVNFMQGNVRLEVIVAVAALVFFFVGLYFNQRQSVQPQQPAPEKKEPPAAGIDYEALKQTGLSSREQEVLLKMTEGLSNQEIGQQLFLSENTIKTHVSNILFKLDAKRRTDAIRIAREKRLVV